MSELVKVIMSRENMSRKEACEFIYDSYLECDCELENTLEDLGLEPDYVFDLNNLITKIIRKMI